MVARYDVRLDLTAGAAHGGLRRRGDRILRQHPEGAGLTSVGDGDGELPSVTLNPARYGGVSSKDGAPYYSSPIRNRAVVPADSYYALTGGRSQTYTRGASLWGVSLSVSTGYNRNHTQRITTGPGKFAHDIWGKNGPVDENPGVLYSF
jgi:hypothetical protein